MRVKLSCTISTIIELSEGVTLEEARKEIFNRWEERLDEDPEYVSDIEQMQSNCVVLDEVIGVDVTSSFTVIE